MSRENQSRWAFAIVFVVVAAGILLYFTERHSSPPAAPVRPSIHETDSHGNTFDSNPFPSSTVAQQLVLSGAQGTEYFDSAESTGLIYKINQDVAQVTASYQKDFVGTDWALVASSSNFANIMVLANSKTKTVARITLNALPAGAGTAVTIGVSK